MNLFIGNNFSKVAVIFRYSKITYQWCNYCHRDAHYIIYYKSVHISGITLHSIPNLFAKLIFPWWFRIKNPLEVLEQTFKIHSLNRKRINLLPPRFYQENEITILGYSATNRRKLIYIYIHRYATRDIFFPLSRSCRWRVFSFISGRITNAKLITGERKSRGDKSRSVQPCWSTGSGEKLTSS